MSKTFLDFLIEKSLIDPLKANVLQKTAVEQGVGFQDVIINERLISEGKLFQLKAEFLNLPLIVSDDLSEISREVLMEISEEAAKNYKIVPFRKIKDVLEVGMVNPEDISAREALNFIASQKNLKTKIFIITISDFNEFLKNYKTLRGEIKIALEELEKELVEAGLPSRKRKVFRKEAVGEADKFIMEAPISKIVAVIIRHATEDRASDIHIEPLEKNLRVRFRVDGVLRTNLFLPLAVHAAVVSRIKILSNLKIDETRIPQDGRFHAAIGQKKIDFRVSTFPTSNGEKVVMRILDPSVGFLTLEEIGIEGRNLRLIQEEAQKPFGMILITGPTGSGKSTTLYSLFGILNKESVNIVSLEDPVEYYIDGVSQSQIKPEIGYTFASGLRHILRQDPDTIMVGEIRDGETAQLAVHAALTGHIVLSTLHTNNALGVIPRLIDMTVEPFLIPASLNLAAAQRLVRRLCVECRQEVIPSPAIAAMIKKEIGSIPGDVNIIKEPLKIYESRGCKACHNKGTKGRIAIFEMISVTRELEEIIIKSPTESEIEKEARRQGMITMKQDGILKVLRGIVGIDEVLRATEE